MEILIQIVFFLLIISWIFGKLFGGVISRSNNAANGHIHEFTIPLASKKNLSKWNEKVTKLGCACGASKKV